MKRRASNFVRQEETRVILEFCRMSGFLATNKPPNSPFRLVFTWFCLWVLDRTPVLWMVSPRYKSCWSRASRGLLRLEIQSVSRPSKLANCLRPQIKSQRIKPYIEIGRLIASAPFDPPSPDIKKRRKITWQYQ